MSDTAPGTGEWRLYDGPRSAAPDTDWWEEAIWDGAPNHVYRIWSRNQEADELCHFLNRAAKADTPEWALKGRDGEPVTLLQKLEQVMEFASAMEKLAIENHHAQIEAEAKADTAASALEVMAAALRKLHRCSRCGGDGSPQCVTCDDYQYCNCEPGHGRLADKCWACEGTGINNKIAIAALDALAKETQ